MHMCGGCERKLVSNLWWDSLSLTTFDRSVVLFSEEQGYVNTVSKPHCIAELSVDGRCCYYHSGFKREDTAPHPEYFRTTQPAIGWNIWNSFPAYGEKAAQAVRPWHSYSFHCNMLISKHSSNLADMLLPLKDKSGLGMLTQWIFWAY